MKILTTGCSFTHADNSWAQHLKKDYDVVNVASGGNGQMMIYRSAINATVNNDFDFFICELSGINRFELFLNEDYPQFKYLVEKVPDWWLQFDNPLGDRKKFCYIKNAGSHKWWKKTDEIFDNENFKNVNFKYFDFLIEEYLKYFYYDEEQLIKTLETILNLQNHFKNLKIKQKYFFWQNEFKYFKKYFSNPYIKNLMEMIDWDLFWFHNKEDGFSEWGVDNGFTGDIGINNNKIVGHPTTEMHVAFCEQVIKKFL